MKIASASSRRSPSGNPDMPAPRDESCLSSAYPGKVETGFPVSDLSAVDAALQRLPDQRQPERRGQARQSRKDRQPRRIENGVLALLQDRAPIGRRRLHAEPEKA